MKNTELIPLQIEDKIIEIRNQNVILDFDVAKHYDVETKRINEAVKNNPDKFPDGFVFELSDSEIVFSRSKISTLDEGRGSNIKYPPKAFTEQGLYMLATILKSPKATQATLDIVTTFAKMRELSRNIAMMSAAETDVIEPEIVEKSGSLLNDILFSHLPTTSEETSLEFNIGVMKGKRTIKSESLTIQNELNALKKRIENLENPQK
ncbi:MAG: ORF6N domain-containing protein [Bacteroidales bacterium]|nr:ORF6N domain-containing protein [Bacteroidales bacterium]